LHARDAQCPPAGAWSKWLLLAGRGFGKTRSAAEWVRHKVESREAKRVALVARTAADVRDTIIEGESGLLAISPPWNRPRWEPSKRRLTWPNGAIATTYTADEPDSLRGPQHDAAWCDELATWKYPDAWDQLLFGLRLGAHPQVVISTTPRPTKIIRELIAESEQSPGSVVVTRGSTYENRANLAAAFLDTILRKYEGTRLGRQELYAEVLGDTPGALWTRALCEAAYRRDAPRLVRVLVSVDPSVADDGGGDECGIVVVGLDEAGDGWVLADASGHMSPEAWASRACERVVTHEAHGIVAEKNNGGALVELTLRAAWKDPGCLPPKVTLVHASVGKRARAEPVAALYEQNRVHHLPGLTTLEDEMCGWSASSGEASPNRIDALVHGLTALMLGAPAKPRRPVSYDHDTL